MPHVWKGLNIFLTYLWALYPDLMAVTMRVPAQMIIVFSRIANFRVKIELNNNRASTRHWNPSSTWNYVPWKVTGEHFNSQNSHWLSQGHQLQWFQSFYPQDLPWLQEFSSYPDGNSKRYLKPQIQGIWGCGYLITLRWKQSKTGSFWFFAPIFWF